MNLAARLFTSGASHVAHPCPPRGGSLTIEKKLLEEEADLKAIATEQARIRENISKVPKESDAFQRYLKKFDAQETEIEQRQAKIKPLTADLEKQRAALQEFIKGVIAE